MAMGTAGRPMRKDRSKAPVMPRGHGPVTPWPDPHEPPDWLARVPPAVNLQDDRHPGQRADHDGDQDAADQPARKLAGDVFAGLGLRVHAQEIIGAH